MANEAERLRDEAEEGYALHVAGECDRWCEWCAEEEDDEANGDGIEPLDFEHDR